MSSRFAIPGSGLGRWALLAFAGLITALVTTAIMFLMAGSSAAQSPDFSGTISNEDGSPAANVWVNFYESTPERARTEWLGGTLTDASGRYRFATSGGCNTAIAVAPFGSEFDAFGSRKRYDEKFGCAGSNSGFISTLFSRPAAVDGALDGRVRFDDGAIASNVKVDLFTVTNGNRRGNFIGTRQTDANGRYSFTVSAGCYVAVTIAPAGTSFGSVGAGDRFDEELACSPGPYGFNAVLFRDPVRLPPPPTIERLFVGPALRDCVGLVPRQCLQVSSSAGGPFSNFFDPIQGFDFEPGTSYELLVEVTQVLDPPPDAPNRRFRLVEIVARTGGPGPVPSPSCSALSAVIVRVTFGYQNIPAGSQILRNGAVIQTIMTGGSGSFTNTPPPDGTYLYSIRIDDSLLECGSFSRGPVSNPVCVADSAVIGRVTFRYQNLNPGSRILRNGEVILTDLSGDGTFSDSPPAGSAYLYEVEYDALPSEVQFGGAREECGSFSVGAVSNPSCSPDSAVIGRVTFRYENVNPGSRVLRNGEVILTDISGDGTFSDSPGAPGAYNYQIQYDALPSETQFINAIEDCGSFTVGAVSNPSCSAESAVIGRVTFRFENANPGSRVLRNGQVLLASISGNGTFTDSPGAPGVYNYQIQYDSLPSEVQFINAIEDCGDFTVGGGVSNPSCTQIAANGGTVSFSFNNVNIGSRILRNGQVLFANVPVGNGTFSDTPGVVGTYVYEIQYDSLPSEVQFINATETCGSFVVLPIFTGNGAL